jgi:thymidylate synthase (FAD)
MSEVNMVAITESLITKEGENTELNKSDAMTVEEFVSYVARVSNPANQANMTTASKLLKYLARNRHWSPFEMVNIVMEIKTTRDIGRQILRHRSFSFQEFSQRYAKVVDMAPPRETRLQDLKNRQNSIDISEAKKIDLMTADILDKEWHAKQQAIIDTTSDFYNWALDNGIAKEQARAILPEGLTMTRMYMSGSLRSWIHYCLLRMDALTDENGVPLKGTQKEHREIAEKCWKLIIQKFPALESILEKE